MPASLPDVASSAQAFEALARRRLRPSPAPLFGGPDLPIAPPSDFDLNPDAAATLPAVPAQRPAAVLVPIVARAELTLLLTQRTAHLAAHAGQIAFPGGKIEPHDPDAAAAALREAREEIGLESRFVRPLGFLDPYRTGTGFRITPLVALVDPGFSLALDDNEVASAFEVPLAFLMDPQNHQIHIRKSQGRDRRFYAMPYGERFIWGATAGMLRNLQERLFTP